eukprot:gene55650-4972_t
MPSRSAFRFRTDQRDRLRVHDLVSLDLASVERNVDLDVSHLRWCCTLWCCRWLPDVLQRVLKNVAYAPLREGDVARPADAARVVRVAQLLLQYLLHTQGVLEDRVAELAARGAHADPRAAHAA